MSLRNELAEVANGEAGTAWAGRDGELNPHPGHQRTTERMFRNLELAPAPGDLLPVAGGTDLKVQRQSGERWAYGFKLHPVKCPNCSHVTWMSHPPKKGGEPCSKACREDLGIIPRKRGVDFLPTRRRTPEVQMERNKNYWRWENEEREIQREQWI